MTFFVKRPGRHDGVPVGEPEYPDDHGGVDARVDEWALFLPHRCDAWTIAVGSRADVLAAGLAFREQLDEAIRWLEREAQGGEGT